MANIKIEGYRTISPNEVFGRASNPIPHNETKLLTETTELIYLQRYGIPRTDDVLQAIVTSAAEVRDEKSKDKYTFSEIAKFLKIGIRLNRINSEYIEKIASSEKETIDHIKRHMPPTDLEQGRYYLKLFNGTIINDILKTSAPVIKSIGNNKYGEMIELCCNDSLIFTLMMQDSKTLPDRSEIEYLMKRRANNPAVSSIAGKGIDYQKFIRIVEWFYNLSTTKEVEKIPDTSLPLFVTTASTAIAVSAICKRLRESPFEKEGNGTLMETLESLFGQLKRVDETGFQKN